MTVLEWANKPHNDWTDDDLAVCARWWAKELNLQSWELVIQFKSYRDLHSNWAELTPHPHYENAELYVARWLDRQDCEDPAAGDVEVSVVHELVHLRFWSANSCFDDAGSLVKAIYEAAVEKTAQALVRQRRRGGEVL